MDDAKLGGVTEMLERSTMLRRTLASWRYGLEKWYNKDKCIPVPGTGGTGWAGD